MRITKVYTRKGDGGETQLGGGQTVSKADARIAACGAVDELNSSIGVVIAGGDDARSQRMLSRVQNDLFHAGSELCMLEEDQRKWDIPRIKQCHVDALESEIDTLQQDLKPLEEFVLPGGTPTAAQLHVARAVCRRAETCVVALAQSEAVSAPLIAYLNRLSDLLFVMARHDNWTNQRADVLWDKKA